MASRLKKLIIIEKMQ